MSNEVRKITRNQLAMFLPDQRAIRAFEQVLEQLSDLLPAQYAEIVRQLQEINIDATGGLAKAQQAIDAVNSLSNAVQLLASAPKTEQEQFREVLSWLSPE